MGGGKRKMKGKKRDRKFSPGQTNKNSLIPRLPCSIFCHECEPAFVCRPQTPLPLCQSPETIPIKLKPLQTKIPYAYFFLVFLSLLPMGSQMTNNTTLCTKASIYSLLSYDTVFSHRRKINRDLVQ